MITFKLKNLFLTLALIMLFVACHNAKDKEAYAPAIMEQAGTEPAEEMARMDSISTGSGAPLEATPVKIAEKIIKTADIDMRVEDYAKSRASIDTMVRSARAYIAHENETRDSWRTGNSMVIRVANKDFDGLVGRLVTVAKDVNYKRINAQDVTDQFVDIQARLKTKKEIEQRYIQLLAKANKIGDILEIEEKIRVIREEIEAKEGQLKYLSDQVAYSTINLGFYQTYEYEPADKPGFFNRMGSAIASGWQGFLSFIIGFTYAWPLWLILSVGGWLLYKFIKRKINGGRSIYVDKTAARK